MWLVVGLGNPGLKYSMNRHNVGFMCVDYWLESLGNSSPKWKKDHESENITFDFEGEKVVGFTSIQPNGSFKAKLKR